ncbi:secretoglobin family 1D member 2 [Rhinolophus ferrumequinum]|uniref:Uteroglobin n=1 Tax=Rhinolophus ferrumequinum TaxID=59479 RepID=A0A7J7W9U4_RHIFE|nr:secretoglobin family 1D member 2 [Rhinolophus ferrumequinum]
MRLSFPVLLVTLAFCCYEANAKMCPSLISTVRSFLLDSVPTYEGILQFFNPPPEAAQDVVRLKAEVTNRISYFHREKYLSFVTKIVSTCAS